MLGHGRGSHRLEAAAKDCSHALLTFVDFAEGTGAELLDDLEATLQNFLPVLQHTCLIALSNKLITIIKARLIRSSTPHLEAINGHSNFKGASGAGPARATRIN